MIQEEQGLAYITGGVFLLGFLTAIFASLQFGLVWLLNFSGEIGLLDFFVHVFSSWGSQLLTAVTEFSWPSSTVKFWWYPIIQITSLVYSTAAVFWIANQSMKEDPEQ